MDFKKSFSLNLSSETAEKNTVVYGRVRVSVLTERLYRVEYSKNGVFTDCATQKVWNRNFDAPVFKFKKQDGYLIVGTRQNGVCVESETGRVAYAVAGGKKLKICMPAI